MKICTKCMEEKELDCFYYRTTRGTYYAHCKECHKETVRKWQGSGGDAYWLNPKVLKRQRARRYKLTDEELENLLQSSGTKCSICGEEKPLVIDHDHSTGKIRGLLCSRCNLRLGWVELVGIESIMKYLGS